MDYFELTKKQTELSISLKTLKVTNTEIEFVDSLYILRIISDAKPLLSCKSELEFSPTNSSTKPGSETNGQKESFQPSFDPFCAEEIKKLPSLIVSENVVGTHNLLLNKFPIVLYHTLLCTTDFIHQSTHLDSNDFKAIFSVLRNGLKDFLVFFNCGSESGASQSHKHLQLIPLTMTVNGTQMKYPIDRMISETAKSVTENEIFTLPSFRFVHAVRLFEGELNEHTAVISCNELLEFVKKRLPDVYHTTTHLFSFNILMTLKWLFVVPRKCDRAVDGRIAVNSLGFAGTLIAKSAEEAKTIRAKGLFDILKDVTFPL